MARILLIEDSPTEAAVMAQLLERNGHKVTTSGSAEDGIASCKRDKPDLVLMDVVLPGMNGFQATRALSRDAETSHRPRVGHAPGRQGLHRQAPARERPDRADQRTGRTLTR